MDSLNTCETAGVQSHSTTLVSMTTSPTKKFYRTDRVALSYVKPDSNVGMEFTAGDLEAGRWPPAVTHSGRRRSCCWGPHASPRALHVLSGHICSTVSISYKALYSSCFMLFYIKVCREWHVFSTRKGQGHVGLRNDSSLMEQINKCGWKTLWKACTVK